MYPSSSKLFVYKRLKTISKMRANAPLIPIQFIRIRVLSILSFLIPEEFNPLPITKSLFLSLSLCLVQLPRIGKKTDLRDLGEVVAKAVSNAEDIWRRSGDNARPWHTLANRREQATGLVGEVGGTRR